MQGDLTKGVDFKADVIVANLMADLVMLLSEDARKHLTEDGIFISSGILVEKEEMVSAAIREAGFRIVEIAEDGVPSRRYRRYDHEGITWMTAKAVIRAGYFSNVQKS